MDKKIISIYMGNPDNSNHAELELPATPWEMVDAMDRLRLSEGQDPYWQVEDMGRYEFLAPHLDGYDLYQFNALAEKLRTFSDVDAVAFEGLVQMDLDKLWQNNGGELTLRRVLDLAYSVDCCHVVPGITDDAALGRFYVENDFLPDLATVPDSVLEMLDYPTLQDNADTDTFESWLDSWCSNYPGTHWLSYLQSSNEMIESFEQIKMLCWVLIIFIGIIGILNIINTVYSNIHTRVGEIGMQRAIGMSAASLYKTFLWEGAYYGIIASVIGAVFGYVCCIFVGAAQTDALQLVAVPVMAIVEAAIISIVACLLATAIPLRSIARMSIVDSIETVE